MKFKLAAAALLASTAMASAADLAARPYTKAPVAAPIYDWTGFYIGGQLGASSAQTRFQDRDDELDNEGLNPDRKIGLTGGVYGGYNWQVTPSFLVGIDAQWSWYDQKLTGNIGFLDNENYLQAKIRDAGSVKARFGLVFNDTMVYVAAGPAWAKTTLTAVESFEQLVSASKYVGGYAAAVGVEHMITQNWIVKGQFQYASFNTQHAERVFEGDRSRFGQTTDLYEATIGLSYKFGGPGVARY
jgi:outer membrane immunogenic protein